MVDSLASTDDGLTRTACPAESAGRPNAAEPTLTAAMKLRW